MREGRVYVCEWNSIKDGGVVGIIAKLKLKLEGDSLDDLTDQLTDLIANTSGDCEPVIEFEPPAHPGKKEWFRHGFVTLSPDSHFRFAEVSKLTANGFCERCKWPLGDRTRIPIKVQSIWPGDMSFSWDPNAEGLNVLIASQRFLDLFTESERRTLKLAEVLMPARSRKKYFEIVPKRIESKVVIRTLRANGWKCAACRRVCSSNSPDLGYGVQVIAPSHVPKNSPFFIGTSTNYHLCVHKSVWDKRKDAFRKLGISSLPLAVVRSNEVVAKPNVSEIKDAQRRISPQKKKT